MNFIKKIGTLKLLSCFCFSVTLQFGSWPGYLFGQAGQLPVPRIEMMPDQPAPYNQRNWAEVARLYDSMVFDVNKTGQYLPLISIGPSGVNYPQNKTIKLHTYVGTHSPAGSEAINVLPALVGASLVGIDKSNQFGQNWLLMSQDFFNKSNGENIYLNNASTNSGGDWWYDLMPNIFFYQLYDLYPDLGNEANLQFNTIASRFLEAVRAMGGKDTPWSIPNMNYRAWKFKTMQPNPGGVKEPEAAGAYAWVLYHAWLRTGNKEYLKGAEWAIEFLDQWPTNPSYELQLPYGIYVAARMNAELGNTYNIPKMLNWSFDRGALRGWGAIHGTWGGFDVSGLIGEANDGGNDYAFQLNGLQQAAALVPMVRYDKRFAKAIGKWVLNLSNATRLFYPGFLPGHLQDASAWSAANDPHQVMGYEALREKNLGLSPFSTGDALKGGWAATNLALYGTSSIGYLGSLVKESGVEKILQLDLLKTDFFHGPAFPTYLYYNPYNTTKTILFDAGHSNANIYEALSETFIAENVRGLTSLNLPANQAILISLTPAGGVLTYDHHKMLINDTIVDYRQSSRNYTRPVRIKALSATQSILQSGDSTVVYATAFDPDGGILDYKWSATNGSVSGTGEKMIWRAPNGTGTTTIQVIVTDAEANSDTAALLLSVVSKINVAPFISGIQKNQTYLSPGGIVQLTCLATDPNNDSLTYLWTANAGSFNLTTDRTVNWTAPITEGVYTVSVQVKDNGNLSDFAETTVLVKIFSELPGKLIAYYPFSGNTEDISGNQLHGQGFGTVLVPDKNNKPGAACYFNGGTQHIRVANHSILNVQHAITISCWFNAAQLPGKETFLLSHGSWQNRWKISFTPEKHLRWTVNTLNAIGDLDTPFPFGIDSFYHLTVSYDGALMAIYINGTLTAYKALTGSIRTTPLPFLMGQMLAEDAAYNFKGIIDEVKLFDYAFNPSSAAALYLQSTTALKASASVKNNFLKISPNPVSNFLSVQSAYASNSTPYWRVSDFNGRTVLEKKGQPGNGEWILDISKFVSGVYIITMHAEHFMAFARFVKL